MENKKFNYSSQNECFTFFTIFNTVYVNGHLSAFYSQESGSWTDEQRHGTEENPENDAKNPETSKNLEDEIRRRSLQSDLVKAIIHKLPLENIQKLLQLGADINSPLEYGMRPIHFAASANNIEVIDFCLKFGCDINCKDCCGLTPVHLSAQKGHVECLKYLISQGANVRVDNRGYKASKKVKNNMATEDKSKNDESDENNAQIAGVNNQIPTESDDENHDEDNTSGKAPKGFTTDMTVEPLNFALENNHEEAVKLLLENGANPNRWYPVGYEINLVPLKNIRCLELMLDFGASPNAVDRCGYTPLMMAAKKNQMLATQLLLHRGANINQQRPNRFEMKTALHIALEAGNRDITKILLMRGAITFKLPDYKYNAVHTAVLTDRVDLVELVLFFHADVDEVTDDNCTALMLACAHTDLQNQMLIIHKLLQNGANPNYHSGITNYSAPSFSPLVEYLSNQQIIEYNIVLKLIQYGAKVHFSGSSRVIRKKDPFGILSYIPCLKMNENAWGLVIDATSMFDINAISQCNYFNEEEKKFFLMLGTKPFSLRHLVRLSIRKLLKPPLTKKIFLLPLPKFLLKYLLFLVA